MAEKNLFECNDKTLEPVVITDPVSPICSPTLPSLKDVAFDNAIPDCGDVHKGFSPECSPLPKRVGLGQQANCAPVQRSWAEDLRQPSNETVVRYSQALRACDEAMKDLFSDLIIFDDEGVAHNVPIVVANPEKAVAIILQENVRKDGSFVVDRIKLPLLSIYYKTNMAMNQQRYLYSKALDYFRDADFKPGWTITENQERDTVFGRTRGIPVDIGYQLTAWTMHTEDMNQILEQMFTKFDPIAYIRLQNVNYETIVKLDSTANNINAEPGDKQIRVIKWQFNMTVETYIPQHIARKKAVLDIKANIVSGATEEDIQEVLKKLEISVRD